MGWGDPNILTFQLLEKVKRSRMCGIKISWFFSRMKLVKTRYWCSAAIGVEDATFEVGWAKCFKVFSNMKKLKLLGQCQTKF